jgi:hypothetical protein
LLNVLLAVSVGICTVSAETLVVSVGVSVIVSMLPRLRSLALADA